MTSPTLINDFAVAEYNNKKNPKTGITPNNISATMAKLDEYEHFSFVVNERYLFLIKCPYNKKKIDGADYVENHLYKEIYKNAYMISKPEEEYDEELTADQENEETLIDVIKQYNLLINLIKDCDTDEKLELLKKLNCIEKKLLEK